MRWFCVSTVAVLCCLFVTTVHADEPVKIRLKDIWAFNIPNTIDVRDLEPDRFGEQTRHLTSRERFRLLRDSLSQRIANSLDTSRENLAGFAVEGIGREALSEAERILVRKEAPSDTFATGTDISVIFFSLSSEQYVRLRDVLRRGNEIDVQYELVFHKEHELTSHFAIIPFKNLDSGQYRVKYIAEPGTSDEQKRKISQPFAFTIK